MVAVPDAIPEESIPAILAKAMVAWGGDGGGGRKVEVADGARVGGLRYWNKRGDVTVVRGIRVSGMAGDHCWNGDCRLVKPRKGGSASGD